MNDFRYAARQLRRTPAFTFVAVVTLALGIGATTGIFSVVNSVLIRPLPVLEPDRLVSIEIELEPRRFRSSIPLAEYLEYRERAAGIIDLAAHRLSDVALNIGEQSTVTLGFEVTGSYFNVLGIQPALGRFFDDHDRVDTTAADVVVISHELWQGELGGDPGVLGRTLHVNSQPLTVIGVASNGFHGTLIGARPAVWLPVGQHARLQASQHDADDDPASVPVYVFGRLGPETGMAQAEAAFATFARQYESANEHRRLLPATGARLQKLSAIPPRMRSGARGVMVLLLTAAGFVLAIAAVNVSGMLLARGAERGREMGIRLALGARRARLVRQLLVESMTLAIIGTAAGVMLGVWLTKLLALVRPPLAGSFVLDFSADLRVVAFTALVSMTTAILFGLAPALYATRGQLGETLKDNTMHHRRTRLRNMMVVGQLALALVLLVSASLFVRTLQNALNSDYGFEAQGVIAIELDLALNGYDESGGRIFYNDLLTRLHALPAVDSASLARAMPLGTSWEQARAQVPGISESGMPYEAGINAVSPGYFDTFRMAILSGRGFEHSDRMDQRPVAVINESFARRFWPGTSPVGMRLTLNDIEREIIGVIPDPRPFSAAGDVPLLVYVPFEQAYAHAAWLQVRWRGDMASSVAAVRSEIRDLDPNVAPVAVTTVEEVLNAFLFPQRLAAQLVGGFGFAGLVLAAIGLFGVLSFAVSQRTREIGLRMALGAEPLAVVGLVVRDGIKLLVYGIVIGLIAALTLTQLLTGLLHGISPNDPVAIAAVCGILILVTGIAMMIPARRAVNIDPMRALREE